MDISSLYNVSSAAVKEAVGQTSAGKTQTITENEENGFSSVFNKALENLNTTNSYLSDAENEELRLAMGETSNTHDLTVALNKASTALNYTVAIRDKFLDAYKELMQIQI